MKKLFCLVVVSILITSNVFSDNIDSLRYGNYKVGFNITSNTDESRSSRTIKTYTWYPAKTNQMSIRTIVSDYLDESKPKKGSRKNWETITIKPANAYINAKKIDSAFSIVVIAQGYHYESIASQAVLAEYLASYGFIVTTCPLKGTNEKSVKLNIADLETQVKDLEFILSVAQSTFQNNGKYGIVGFDLGGLSAALTAMNNPDIDCVISLDGGLIFQHNLDYIKNSQYYNPENLIVPILQVTRSIKGNIGMGLKEDLSLFNNSKKSTKYILRFDKIKHSEFTSYNLMGIENNGSGSLSLSRKQLNPSVEIYHEYALNFLTGILNDDNNSMNFINKPVDEHNFSITVTMDILFNGN
jgi:dienelactone hydrolase